MKKNLKNEAKVDNETRNRIENITGSTFLTVSRIPTRIRNAIIEESKDMSDDYGMVITKWHDEAQEFRALAYSFSVMSELNERINLIEDVLREILSKEGKEMNIKIDDVEKDTINCLGGKRIKINKIK